MDDKVSEALESCERIDHNARPEKGMSENRASLIHGHTATIRDHIHARDAELARLRREAARDDERAHEVQGMLEDMHADRDAAREESRDMHVTVAVRENTIKRLRSERDAALARVAELEADLKKLRWCKDNMDAVLDLNARVHKDDIAAYIKERGRHFKEADELRTEIAALRSRLASQGAREVAELQRWSPGDAPGEMYRDDDGEWVYLDDLLPSDGGEV